MTVRVVIADDQELVRSGFRMILNGEPDIEVVGEAADGHQAISVSHSVRPDVVLMDIRMPGLDGIAATRRLTAASEWAPVRVLILTTFNLDEYVFGALKAGASGFLLKDTPPAQLAEAVRIVASGAALLGPTITSRLISAFVAVAPEPLPPEFSELTPREVEILRLVAKGMSNTEIATSLVISESTVKTHVTRVLMKLGLRDRVHAVVFAHKVGLAATEQERLA